MRTKLRAVVTGALVTGMAVALGVSAASGDAPEGAKAQSASGMETVAAAPIPPKPRAQALVAANKTVSRLKGFTGVGNPAPGVWCLSLPASIPDGSTAPAVTPDWTTSPNSNVSAQVVTSGLECPGNAVQIYTFSEANDVLTKSNQGFTVSVP